MSVSNAVICVLHEQQKTNADRQLNSNSVSFGCSRSPVTGNGMESMHLAPGPQLVLDLKLMAWC